MKNYISPTQIKAMIRCPYAYYLAYVQGVEPQEIPDIVSRGQDLHEDLLYNQKIFSPAIYEPEIVRDIYIAGKVVRLKGYPDIVQHWRVIDVKSADFRTIDYVSYYDRIQMQVYRLLTNLPTFVLKVLREEPRVQKMYMVEFDIALLHRVFKAIEDIEYVRRTGKLPDDAKPAIFTHPHRCETCIHNKDCIFYQTAKASET